MWDRLLAIVNETFLGFDQIFSKEFHDIFFTLEYSRELL